MNSYLERQVSKVNGTGPLILPRPRTRFENLRQQDSNELTTGHSLGNNTPFEPIERRSSDPITEPGAMPVSGDDSKPTPVFKTGIHPDNQMSDKIQSAVIGTMAGIPLKQDKKKLPPSTPLKPEQKKTAGNPPMGSILHDRPSDVDAGKPDLVSHTVENLHRRPGQDPDQDHPPAHPQTPGDRQYIEELGPYPAEKDLDDRGFIHPPLTLLSRPDRNDENQVFLEQEIQLSPETNIDQNPSDQSGVNSLGGKNLAMELPEMNITVEIKNVVIENQPPPLPQVVKRPELRKPRMSLSQYLERRSGGNA